MDIKQLFKNALNPNTEIRKEAEQQLKTLQKHPNFIMSLPLYFNSPEPEIKKVSAIIFKNSIKEEWNSTLVDHKQQIMSSILDLINSSEQGVQIDLNIVLSFILESEDLENWICMLEKANYFMAQEDLKINFAGVLFFKLAMKNDKIKYNSDNICKLLGPCSVHLFRIFCLAFDKNDYILSKMVLKIFNYVNDVYSVNIFIDDINYFSTVYKAIAESLKKESADANLFKHKKWAVRFFCKSLKRCFRNTKQNKDIKNFIMSDINFMFTYNLIIECMKKEIATSITEEKQGFLKHCCNFLSIIVTDGENNAEIVKKDLSFIIFYFIYPLYIFSENDEELFEDNPKKYLADRYNYYAIDLKGYAGILFTEIMKRFKKDRPLFTSIFNEFINILNIYKTNPTKENACRKMGAVFLISFISKRLKSSTEEFLATHVIPDLFSHYAFLRSIGCYSLQYFEGSEIGAKTITHALEGVLANLKSENEILKADAALAITFFFENDAIQENIKKSIPFILQNLLELQKNNELEAINDVLENVITNYPEEIKQFAPELVLFLCSMILSNINNLTEDKALLYSGFLRTITGLIETLDKNPELAYNIYCIAADTLFIVFRNKIIDLYPDAIDLLSQLIYTVKKVDDSMWNIFISIMSMDHNEKINNADELTCLLDNYISYGDKDKIIIYIKLIFNFVEIQCIPAQDYFYDDDHINGCKILQSLLLNLETRMSEYIPFIVDTVVSFYDHFDREGAIMIHYLDVIMNCFLINLEITWQKLESMGILTRFFKDLFEFKEGLVRVFDKKMCILFVCSLMKRNDEFISNFIDIFKIKTIFLTAMESLPKAIDKRNKLMDDEVVDDEDGEYTDLEEDIYISTPLDKFNAFEFVKMTGREAGLVGKKIFESFCEKERNLLGEILSKTYLEK